MGPCCQLSLLTEYASGKLDAAQRLLAVLGLAILVTLFRNRRTIDVEQLDAMKG